MAWQRVGKLEYPVPAYYVGVSVSTYIINNDNEQIAQVFTCDRSGTIDTCSFKIGTINGDCAVRVALLSVGTDSRPTTTVLAYRDFTISGTADGTWITTGLLTSDGTDTGTKLTVTAGQMYALQIRFNEWGAGNEIRFYNSGGYGVSNFLVSDLAAGTYEAPVWSYSAAAVNQLYFNMSGGGYMVPPHVFLGSTVSVAWSSSSDPIRRGGKYNFPFGLKIRGIGVSVIHPTSSGCTAKLYAADGKTLVESMAPASTDPDGARTTSAAYPACFYFSTLREFPANTDFYIYIESTGTANITMYKYDVAGITAVLPYCHLTDYAVSHTQHGAADPIPDTNSVPSIGLFVEEIDFPTGGSTAVQNMTRWGRGFN